MIEFELEKIGGSLTPDDLSAELKTIFALPKKPKRIEAFNVAHISNLDFVAASCVWKGGEIRPDQMRFRVVEAGGEPQAMASGVLDRLTLPPAPDLIVVDGGKGQLNAVVDALRTAGVIEIPVISAANPPESTRRSRIFFGANGERIHSNPETARTNFFANCVTKPIKTPTRCTASIAKTNIFSRMRILRSF